MNQLTHTSEKVKQSSRFNVIKPVSIVKSLLKLPVEWKLLYGLLTVMVLRLAIIIAFVLTQL